MGQVASNEIVLASAVASPAGTVAFAYPTGYVQADFTSDNASASAYLLLNDNDRFEEADDEFDISYGASTVTVTNKTGYSWPIGTRLRVGLARADAVGDFRQAGAVADITDSSGGTASDDIAATVGIQTVAIPLNLVSMTTSAADLMTNYTPGYAFELLSLEFVTTKLGTGTSASQTINMEIGSTNVTGGALAILLADTDTLGKKKAASAITAANVGTASDTISFEVAASGTVFTAGEGYMLLKLRNLDTVNAIKSLSTKLNAVLAKLRSSGLIAAA